MSREYSERDIQVLDETAAKLAANRFDMDTTRPGGKANGQAIIAFFELNPHIPVTEAAVFAYVERIKDTPRIRRPKRRPLRRSFRFYSSTVLRAH